MRWCARTLAARVALAVAAASGAAACGGDRATRSEPPASTVVAANAVVVRVVDGDTVVLDVDGRSEHARLIGIDTPETVRPDSPVECFGPEASAATAALVPDGTAVRVERDVEARDDYDRLLVYLFRADDGTFVNLELVRAGFATVFTYPPNVAHADRFVAAAAEARAAGRGLWSGCAADAGG